MDRNEIIHKVLSEEFTSQILEYLELLPEGLIIVIHEFAFISIAETIYSDNISNYSSKYTE